MTVQTKANFPFLGIKLLKSFTKKELNRFQLFISSPYFNTDDKVLILLTTLVENVFIEETFTDRLQCLVFEIVFEQKTNQQKLELHQKKTLAAKLSKLSSLAQKFLVTEGLDKHEIQYNELLYRELLDKKQFDMFLSASIKKNRTLENKQRKTIEDFEHIYRTELFYLEYLSLTGEIYKKNIDVIFKSIYYLDVQYILNRLCLFSTISSFRSNQILNHEKISISTMDSLLISTQYLKEPNILVYKANYNFLKKFDESKYSSLLETLKKHEKKIPLSEIQGMYIGLLNFITVENRKGVNGSNKALFNLYNLMDEKNLLLADSFMSSIKLKNLIGDSLKVAEIDRAKYFLEKYIAYVAKKDRKSVNNFCLSAIAFYEKNYDLALEHIIKVENINLTYDVNCRFLTMKIYYETDQEYNERTVRLFRSAELFFKGNKALSAMDKKSYKNFVQILVNLYRIKHNEGKMTLQKLQAKLEQQEFNADKKWLLKKMEELVKCVK